MAKLGERRVQAVMNRQLNKQRIRNAVAVLFDDGQASDHDALRRSVTELVRARDWARTRDLTMDENDALWALSECLERMERYGEALAALRSLRVNLESLRSRITDPFQRAGVIHGEYGFPRLFERLCALCHRAAHAEDLLDAIEGAKGRTLADLLARDPRSAAGPVAPLVRALTRRTGAHYLTYLVGKDCTYAALVAKDGSLHTRAIPLGRDVLRRESWQEGREQPRSGLFGRTADTRETLAPLVRWLEPALESGPLTEGDHICYCPDEDLHLIPLHSVVFRGRPLVRAFSVSRIQSAAALASLLGQEPHRPRRCVALEVPAREDVDNADKLQAFARAGEWLAKRFPGEVLRGAEAGLPRLRALDWRGRVVHFATHGTFPLAYVKGSRRDPNPYSGSGLLLACNGQLPAISRVENGELGGCLLTPRVVRELDLSGSHVTVQACVSGLAREGIAGDALGLEWALFQRGARSVLTTHWNVDATEAAELSVRFYQRWLAGGQSRAQAWRGTVLELMDAGWKPRHWAAVSLSGDWR